MSDTATEPDQPLDKADVVFVSVPEAARLLGVSPRHLHDVLNRGEIDSRYSGSRRLVRLASLRAFIDGLPAKRDPKGSK